MSKKTEQTQFSLLPIPDIHSPKSAQEDSVDRQTTRLCIDVAFELMEKVKDYAYWEGLTQQQIALEALTLFFGDKQIKSRPERVKNRAKLGRKPKHA